MAGEQKTKFGRTTLAIIGIATVFSATFIIFQGFPFRIRFILLILYIITMIVAVVFGYIIPWRREKEFEPKVARNKRTGTKPFSS